MASICEGESVSAKNYVPPNADSCGDLSAGKKRETHRRVEFYAWIKLLPTLLRRFVPIYQQAGPELAWNIVRWYFLSLNWRWALIMLNDWTNRFFCRVRYLDTFIYFSRSFTPDSQRCKTNLITLEMAVLSSIRRFTYVCPRVLPKEAESKNENRRNAVLIVGLIECFPCSFRSKENSRRQFPTAGPFADLFIKAVSLLINWNWRPPSVDA